MLKLPTSKNGGPAQVVYELGNEVKWKFTAKKLVTDGDLKDAWKGSVKPPENPLEKNKKASPRKVKTNEGRHDRNYTPMINVEEIDNDNERSLTKKALNVYENEIQLGGAYDLGVKGPSRASLRTVCKGIVLKATQLARRNSSVMSNKSDKSTGMFHNNDNPLSLLRQLQVERNTVNRMGFVEKAQAIDREIRMLRIRAEESRKKELAELYERESEVLQKKHQRRFGRLETRMLNERHRLQNHIETQFRRLKDRQRGQFVRALEAAERRCNGKLKKCNCDSWYTCTHNKSASYNTRRAKPEVITFRRNADRLKKNGRRDDAVVWEEKALDIDLEHQDKWRQNISDGLVASSWGANEATVDKLVRDHKHELQTFATTASFEQEKLEEQHKLLVTSFNNWAVADMGKMRNKAKKLYISELEEKRREALQEESLNQKALERETFGLDVYSDDSLSSGSDDESGVYGGGELERFERANKKKAKEEKTKVKEKANVKYTDDTEAFWTDMQGRTEQSEAWVAPTQSGLDYSAPIVATEKNIGEAFVKMAETERIVTVNKDSALITKQRQGVNPLADISHGQPFGSTSPAPAIAFGQPFGSTPPASAPAPAPASAFNQPFGLSQTSGPEPVSMMNSTFGAVSAFGNNSSSNESKPAVIPSSAPPKLMNARHIQEEEELSSIVKEEESLSNNNSTTISADNSFLNLGLGSPNIAYSPLTSNVSSLVDLGNGIQDPWCRSDASTGKATSTKSLLMSPKNKSKSKKNITFGEVSIVSEDGRSIASSTSLADIDDDYTRERKKSDEFYEKANEEKKLLKKVVEATDENSDKSSFSGFSATAFASPILGDSPADSESETENEPFLNKMNDKLSSNLFQSPITKSDNVEKKPNFIPMITKEKNNDLSAKIRTSFSGGMTNQNMSSSATSAFDNAHESGDAFDTSTSFGAASLSVGKQGIQSSSPQNNFDVPSFGEKVMSSEYSSPVMTMDSAFFSPMNTPTISRQPSKDNDDNGSVESNSSLGSNGNGSGSNQGSNNSLGSHGNGSGSNQGSNNSLGSNNHNEGFSGMESSGAGMGSALGDMSTPTNSAFGSNTETKKSSFAPSFGSFGN